MAGVVGINPLDLTFFELYQMYISRQYWESKRFCEIMTLMAAFGGTHLDADKLNQFSDIYKKQLPQLNPFQNQTQPQVSAEELYGLLNEQFTQRTPLHRCIGP